MTHKHDQNGNIEEVTIVVGNELVTYQRHHCSCGHQVSNKIVRREKMV